MKIQTNNGVSGMKIQVNNESILYDKENVAIRAEDMEFTPCVAALLDTGYLAVSKRFWANRRKCTASQLKFKDDKWEERMDK